MTGYQWKLKRTGTGTWGTGVLVILTVTVVTVSWQLYYARNSPILLEFLDDPVVIWVCYCPAATIVRYYGRKFPITKLPSSMP